MGRGDMLGGDLGRQIRAQVSDGLQGGWAGRNAFGSRDGGGGNWGRLQQWRAAMISLRWKFFARR